MVGSKSGARSLGLVAIVVVLLLGRVAGAGYTCLVDCCKRCADGCIWYNPSCLAACAGHCFGDCAVRAGNIEERKQADAVHYCKLGCASSGCSAIATTLRLYSSAGRVGEEAVKGSVKRCDDACSEICTKRFGTTVIAA